VVNVTHVGLWWCGAKSRNLAQAKLDAEERKKGKVGMGGGFWWQERLLGLVSLYGLQGLWIQTCTCGSLLEASACTVRYPPAERQLPNG
jgi:hypothetical protein